MNQNQSANNRKQKNSFRGFTITSMVIGILMIVVMLAMFMMEYAYSWTMMGGPYFPAWLYLSVLCITFAGLICGIVGLKSNRKRIAIGGIIICFLISIPYIYVTYALLVTPWEFQ